MFEQRQNRSSIGFYYESLLILVYVLYRGYPTKNVIFFKMRLEHTFNLSVMIKIVAISFFPCCWCSMPAELVQLKICKTLLLYRITTKS